MAKFCINCKGTFNDDDSGTHASWCDGLQPLFWKRLISIDFDGVLHRFSGEWKGTWVIEGPPVSGSIDWLASLLVDGRFEIAIYSARSRTKQGREAIEEWLSDHLRSRLVRLTGSDDLLREISYPATKPPAGVVIDDRAIPFDGPDKQPAPDTLWEFRPWWKRDEPRT